MTMVRQRATQRAVRLELDVDPAVDVVPADELRFKQVVINLLSNAVKFASQEVRIRASVGPRTTITVDVIDDGPGVPPEDRESSRRSSKVDEVRRRRREPGSG